MSIFDRFKRKKYNERGEEMMDPKPRAVPIGFEKPEPLEAMLARVLRNQRTIDALARAGKESFDEANDFEVGEDYDPKSPHEEHFYGQFEQEIALEAERVKEVKAREKEIRKKFFEEKPKPRREAPAAPGVEGGGRPPEPVK